MFILRCTSAHRIVMRQVMKPRTIPTIEITMQLRFWALVDRRSDTECWPWLGSSSTIGNATYGVWTYSGYQWKAHRIAYTLAVGPIPDELTLDHVKDRGCTMKLCCNPSHLEPVTQSVNTLRQYSDKDRLYHLTCKRGHAREFGRDGCRRCNVIAVAKSQRNNPDKYLAMKREQKKRERARQRP